MTRTWIQFAILGVLLNVVFVTNPPLAVRLLLGAAIVAAFTSKVRVAHWIGYTAGRQARREEHSNGYFIGHKHGYEQGLREGVRRENSGLIDLYSQRGGPQVIKQIEEMEREAGQ